MTAAAAMTRIEVLKWVLMSSLSLRIDGVLLGYGGGEYHISRNLNVSRDVFIDTNQIRAYITKKAW